jgi:purine-binding chemotaxis protein CheW
MDIKEIIKPREVTEVPRAPHFVSGVLSLRGTIIPIIDMRERLGLACAEPTGKERIVVIKNINSFSGLLVDEVIQVVKVPQDAIEPAPTVLDGIDRDFVSGLGCSDGRLIIILHLENITDINLY